MSKPSDSLHECRVLVTDDDPLVRTVYAEVLRRRGCEVVEARGGSEAVTLARALLPDLVLLDLSMPGMDGWQALAALRDDPRTERLVVVALTGSESREVRERAAAAGFDGYVVKPFTPAALLRELEAVWEQARSRDGAGSGPAGTPGGAASMRRPPAVPAVSP